MQDDWDIRALRADTAGCEQSVFFNNAGASLQPRAVVARVIEHLQVGRADRRLRGSRSCRGELEAVVWQRGAAIALRRRMKSRCRRTRPGPGKWRFTHCVSLRDRIVTAANEYASNYIAFLQVAQRTGAEIRVVESDQAGEVDLEALRKLLDDRVKLIALTHVPTNGGLVQPAAQVGELARRAGIPFLLDATQSAGRYTWMSKLWGAICCARPGANTSGALAAQGFFMSAARCSSKWILRYWTCTQPTGFRKASLQFAATPEIRNLGIGRRYAPGLGVAIEYALALGLKVSSAGFRSLAALLRERLAEVKGVTVQDLGRVRSGIVTFTCEGHPAGEGDAGAPGKRHRGTSLGPVFDPHRHGTARAGRAGQGIRALLQHGSGSRAAL